VNPADPADWNDEAWDKHEAALARITGPKADAFARALDLHGWMIVPQPGVDGGPWPMEAGACPWWASPLDLPKPKPPLRLIPGGKGDGEGGAP
jgi:hypothetical protein